MEIAETVVAAGEIVVLAPKGQINTYTAPALQQKMLALLERDSRRIVVDLVGVRSLTSAALRVLLLVSRRLRPVQGEIVLCRLNESVRKVFAISGFDKDFAIVSSLDEAVAALRRSPHAPPPPAESAAPATDPLRAPPTDPLLSSSAAPGASTARSLADSVLDALGRGTSTPATKAVPKGLGEALIEALGSKASRQ